jgi:hypothetical protein
MSTDLNAAYHFSISCAVPEPSATIQVNLFGNGFKNILKKTGLA